jgi:hypothetical protein
VAASQPAASEGTATSSSSTSPGRGTFSRRPGLCLFPQPALSLLRLCTVHGIGAIRGAGPMNVCEFPCREPAVGLLRVTGVWPIVVTSIQRYGARAILAYNGLIYAVPAGITRHAGEGA